MAACLRAARWLRPCHTGAELLDEVVFPVCRELSLPFAAKMGVTRQVNACLRQAGDSVR